MGKVAIVSALSAVLGYTAVYFAFFAKPEPAAVPEAPAEQTPAEPEMLADVVEMVDTEPLLDARPKKPEGKPFDPVVPAYFTTPAEPAPVELPLAPPPHEPGADTERSFWYGSYRLPKQIGGGLDPRALLTELHRWQLQRNVYRPSGCSVGVGYFF